MKKQINKAKRQRRIAADEILPEYDFSKSRPNKYASRFSGGSAVVVLDPDVAKMFRNAKEVNVALRALGGIIKRHHPRDSSSKHSG